jgi:hypothetical protein
MRALCAGLFLFMLAPAATLAMGKQKPREVPARTAEVPVVRTFESGSILVRKEIETEQGTEILDYAPDGTVSRREFRPRGATRAVSRARPGELPSLVAIANRAPLELSLEQRVQLLRAFDANGARIYDALKSEYTFDHFFGVPDGVVLRFDFGVHESLHVADSERSSRGFTRFSLIDGSSFELPELATFARSDVLRQMGPEEREEHYVITYLTGGTGGQGLEALLRELNAYAHGGNTALAMTAGLGRRGLDPFNEGLQIMMRFVALYLNQAREFDGPATWARLRHSEPWKQGIRALWLQAEEVLGRACAPAAGTLLNRREIDRVYAPGVTSALEELIGQGFRARRPGSCAL